VQPHDATDAKLAERPWPSAARDRTYDGDEVLVSEHLAAVSDSPPIVLAACTMHPRDAAQRRLPRILAGRWTQHWRSAAQGESWGERGASVTWRGGGGCLENASPKITPSATL